MKTTKDEKYRLRGKILDRAVPYFKKNGNSGSGINALMKQAGVTTGALYSHFGSKEDLFTESVCSELEKLEAELSATFEKKQNRALKYMIEAYFDKLNYESVGDGCIYSALGTDMRRSPAAARGRYEDSTLRIYRLFADAIQAQFPKDSEESCYAKALVIYSGFVGAMTMARTMKNQKSAYAVLEAEKRFMLEHFVAPENR